MAAFFAPCAVISKSDSKRTQHADFRSPQQQAGHGLHEHVLVLSNMSPAGADDS